VVVEIGFVPVGALVGVIRAVIGVVSGVCVLVGVGAVVDVRELVFGSVVAVGRLGVVTNGIVVGNPVTKTSFTNGIVVGNPVTKTSFTNGIEVGNPVIKTSFSNGIVVGIKGSIDLLIVVVVGS